MKNAFLSFLLLLFVCSVSAQTKVYINLTKRYQVIEGFSASDCWAGNYVGVWKNQREKTAKWLFCSDLNKSGDPYGIGLSMWRFNIGAGTAEQGDDSKIGEISRRSECMLNADGSYDFTRQAGQQYWLEQAKEYGCEKFVAFSNSPLVHFTRNGKGFSSGGWNANLQEDKYDDFAEYIATITEYFKQEKGIEFSYISPVNEPQYDWKSAADGSAGQEGSPWKNSEVSKLVKELNNSLQSRNLDTKIFVSEAGAWSYIFEGDSNGSGSQAYAFFDPNSPNYIGNLPSVAPIIAGHSYWRDKTNSDIQWTRTTLKKKADEYSLTPFQTEWSMLSGPPGMDGFPGSFEEASYTDNALIMAKIIHADMVYTQAASWSYWTSMDMERWSHMNRFSLLKVEPSGGAYADIRNEGTVTTHKTLWALGNYSLFVRPGYQRIQMLNADDMATLMGSAYVSPDTSRVVAVYINMAYESKEIVPSLINVSGKEVASVSLFRTNSILNLKNMRIKSEYDATTKYSIPARSITTMVYDLVPTGTTALKNEEIIPVNVYPNPVTEGRFAIELPITSQMAPWKLSLLSMSGQEVYTQSVVADGGAQEISVPASLAKGLYVLRIVNAEKSMVTKIEIK